MKRRRKIQDLSTEFNQEIETLKKTQKEMKIMRLRNITAKQENSKKIFARRMNQIKDIFYILKIK